MRFGSVCSGIEAASVAWTPLGWQCAFVSEIEKFPSAVLAHHYPEVPNRGDMTRFQEWPDADIDVLVGGTPCQSFSVAGLRKGLADPRGNLALTYLAIAERYRPRWLVWENVPGVRSSSDGRDFGAFLGGLAELGYGWAYRSLDAQYFGLAQRRERVFVVAHLGDWRPAAAVLFEPHSLSGHPAPRREAGQGTANSFESRAAGSRATDVAPTLDIGAGKGPRRTDSAVAITDQLDASPALGAQGNHSLRVDSQAVVAECAAVASTLNAHFGSKQGLENQHIDGGGALFVAERVPVPQCGRDGTTGQRDGNPVAGGGFDDATRGFL